MSKNKLEKIYENKKELKKSKKTSKNKTM